MADYSDSYAKSLRQFRSTSVDSISTLLNGLIETAIQQAEAIKELNERLLWLERK